jgi:hypothetical protein
MWITCGQRRTGRPGTWQAWNSQTPIEDTQFSVVLWFRQLSRRARPGISLHGNLAVFRHLISCWRRPGFQVRCNHLTLQVEREGSMDWLGLLIPLKLVVFCVILVVIYRMMSGWNSTKLLKLPGELVRCVVPRSWTSRGSSRSVRNS